MGQQEKTLIAKPDNLSLTLGQKSEGDNQLLKVSLWSQHVFQGTHPFPHK